MIYKLTRNKVRRAYYGGKNIDKFYNVEPAELSRYPEEWIASVATAYNTDMVIENEGLSKTTAGEYLIDIINKNPEQVLGSYCNNKYNGKMSLLLKMLDSAERLVIQVHPDLDFAKKYFNSPFGKTECWYMLNDGEVYLGFKPGITKEKWIELFHKNYTAGMLECMHKIPVKKNQLIFVDGGIPHAIGKDCFLIELQEPTDLMVIPERTTPSGVTLADKKMHGGLGFEKMFDCFNYEGMTYQEINNKYILTPRKINDVESIIIDSETTEKFMMKRFDINTKYDISVNGKYSVIFVLSGNGIAMCDVNSVEISTGSQLFVSADTNNLQIKGNVSVIMCYPC